MRVLISGYYGFNNAGDEAILSGMLTAFHRAGRVTATVLSKDPEATERLHGVEAIERTAFGRIGRHLKEQTDLLVSGGGGLLQDRTSRRSALYYLGLIKMAQRAGVPVYLYANGVGPVDSRSVTAVARKVLRRVKGAGVRDAESARVLRHLGVPQEATEVTADPAFALQPVDPAEKLDLLAACDIPWGRRPLMGLIWRHPDVGAVFRREDGGQRRHEMRRRVARGIADFAQEVDARVVVISLYPDADDAEADGMAETLAQAGCAWVHRPQGGSFHRLRALVEAMDFNVSVRYHGLVFSALGGVPALGLAYDPKVEALGRQLGFPTLPPATDPKMLLEELRRLWAQARAVRSDLRDVVAALRERAYGEAVRALAMGVSSPSGVCAASSRGNHLEGHGST